MPDSMLVSAIKVGKRHRRDLGDVAALAASIGSVGLLHPIVVTPKKHLIAGMRRLKACSRLGWKRIPVTVIDLGEIVKGEFAENAHRKDLLPTEIDAIRRALEPLEKAAAMERKRKHGGTAPGKHSAKDSQSGRATDKIGAVAGVSGRTIEKIAAVMEAAKSDPERFGDLPAKMDETGKVDAAYAKVSRRKKHQMIASQAAAAPAEKGPFTVILADPPWKWGHFGEQDAENEEGKGRTPDQHYPTLTHEQILDFKIDGTPVIELAHRNAALYLWCTSSNLHRALEVMVGWGFEFKASIAWGKVKDGRVQTGTGLVFRNAHEILLYGTRGAMPGPQHQPPSLFLLPRGKHSEKPREILAAIERMYPDFDARTRLYLFPGTAGAADGWSSFGIPHR